MDRKRNGCVGGVGGGWCHKETSRTRLTSRTCDPARSSRTGIKSSNSLSWASENQLLIGTACCGWKMYEVGELSMMIVSRRSRPTWDKSCELELMSSVEARMRCLPLRNCLGGCSSFHGKADGVRPCGYLAGRARDRRTSRNSA